MSYRSKRKQIAKVCVGRDERITGDKDLLSVCQLPRCPLPNVREIGLVGGLVPGRRDNYWVEVISKLAERGILVFELTAYPVPYEVLLIKMQRLHRRPLLYRSEEHT